MLEALLIAGDCLRLVRIQFPLAGEHLIDHDWFWREAKLEMADNAQTIARYQEGFEHYQAYIICSVAVDLRVSNVVDVPNYVVSALLPEDIFQG